MTTTYETGEYLDAEQLTAWIYEIRPDLHESATAILGDTGVRTMHRWREQGYVTLDSADKICVALDLHLMEVPEDIWIEKPKRKVRQSLKWEYRRALEMAEEGFFVSEIARNLNVTRNTVRRWLERAA